MWFGLISLFPEMYAPFISSGVVGRAADKGLLGFDLINPREFALDKHRTVDDRPYGGGPGMLMKVQPLQDAIVRARELAPNGSGDDGVSAPKVVYLSPQGRRLDDAMSRSLAKESGLICISGRYEGIDERVIEAFVDEEISIGDYVLSGGELASMVLIDAVSRHIPGVLGHEGSAEEDSFANGLLDCPHYTRPEVLGDSSVPSVLLSGDHEKIRKWRLKQSLIRTLERRPDLLQEIELSEEQAMLLNEILKDVNR